MPLGGGILSVDRNIENILARFLNEWWSVSYTPRSWPCRHSPENVEPALPLPSPDAMPGWDRRSLPLSICAGRNPRVLLEDFVEGSVALVPKSAGNVLQRILPRERVLLAALHPRATISFCVRYLSGASMRAPGTAAVKRYSRVAPQLLCAPRQRLAPPPSASAYPDCPFSAETGSDLAG